MTIQNQIDTYITALLATILTANGYQTDAGAAVYKELEYTAHPDVMPCIAWFPGDLQSGLEVGPVPPELGETNHMYPMSWEGFIADDLDGAAGRMLKADLVKALYEDPRFGGLIEIIDSCKSSVAVQPGDDIFSMVQVSFVIFYVTPFGQE
jgi:hypothetical protein